MPFTLCNLCGSKRITIAWDFLSITLLIRIKRVAASAIEFRVIVRRLG